MMKLWNGKYLDEEDLVADEFCASIGFDQRLWKEDILCSIAHVKKLAAEGKLTEDECDSIVVHLQEILWDAEAGRLHFTAEDHNIQTFFLVETPRAPCVSTRKRRFRRSTAVWIS